MNSHVESYTNWLAFNRCRQHVNEWMTNQLRPFVTQMTTTTDHHQQQQHGLKKNIICAAAYDLVDYCSKVLLITCYSDAAINQVNMELLDNLKELLYQVLYM